jgi:predicted oxidoreductase
LIGSQTPQRLKEAAAALQVRLSRSDWYSVLVAARGAPMP